MTKNIAQEEYYVCSTASNVISEMLNKIISEFHNELKRYVYYYEEKLLSVIVDNEATRSYWGGIINVYSLEHYSVEAYTMLVHIIAGYVNITEERLQSLNIPDGVIRNLRNENMLPNNIWGIHKMIQTHLYPIDEFNCFLLGDNKSVEDANTPVYDVIRLNWTDLHYLERQYNVLNLFVNRV